MDRFIFRIISAFLLVNFTSCITTSEDDNIEHVKVGDIVPAFTIMMSDGSEFDSRTYPTPYTLVFFNTTCVDCRQELPLHEAAYRQGERIVCVARSEAASSIQAYWTEQGWTMPYSPQPDRRVFDLFATQGIPRTYHVGPGYVVTSMHS